MFEVYTIILRFTIWFSARLLTHWRYCNLALSQNSNVCKNVKALPYLMLVRIRNLYCSNMTRIYIRHIPDSVITMGRSLGITWNGIETRVMSQYKDDFSRYGVSIIMIRRSWDRLILIMRTPILVKGHRYHLYIESRLLSNIVRPSYPYNENSYTGKATSLSSLYWESTTLEHFGDCNVISVAMLWFIRQYCHSLVSMVVADDLGSIWRLNICNHHVSAHILGAHHLTCPVRRQIYFGEISLHRWKWTAFI